ncbi:hypothetical protein EV663_1481 [Rhodovulum bhavnagarense]|uniref:Acetyltransferase AlgX (SGNH hydrolase-like protein) n=1 Tax=Rhodovulum bhavnagarense TaxID=992286 RepID=A0A4R2RF55_9RHOB|nr:hypothetical protein [Rhodovulum bhavnagarense]TCP58321.1 hypothetical protein EV663_1481 [Rhodovulum bhavnagarense]
MSEEAKQVHRGKDGFLFLSGGRHGVFELFSGASSPAPGTAMVFCCNLNARSDYCELTDREFRMVVFPDKCVALRDKVGLATPLGSLYARCFADQVAASGAAWQVRYPLGPLDGHEDAFTRTDTHYSALGNLAMVKAILTGLVPDAMLAEGGARIEACIVERPGICGDLGTKLSPAPQETATVLRGSPVVLHMRGNGIKGGNDGICILVDSPEALGKKTLLIFGDSFFRALLPMLAVFYRRVIFCRTRYFHTEMVEAFAPDDIFCGVAERYLSRCNPDADRPHFLSYPLLLGLTCPPVVPRS